MSSISGRSGAVVVPAPSGCSSSNRAVAGVICRAQTIACVGASARLCPSLGHRRSQQPRSPSHPRRARSHQPLAMSAGVTVRDAAHDDWQDFKNLWDGYCLFYNSTVPLEITQHTWARCLDDSDPNLMCLVATSAESGKVIAFATGIVHPSTFSKNDMLYLEDLFVSPEARNMGAATALIDAMKDLVATRGYRKLYWHTLQDNKKAQSLYGKLATLTEFIRYDAD